MRSSGLVVKILLHLITLSCCLFLMAWDVCFVVITRNSQWVTSNLYFKVSQQAVFDCVFKGRDRRKSFLVSLYGFL